MDTLYQLLEWNPVQVGSTFQGGAPPPFNSTLARLGVNRSKTL